MLTLHLHAVLVVNPEALVDVESPTNSATSTVRPGKLKGTWYRVFPETATDVRRISWLDHHIDKFCPADGDGTLISARAMRSLWP